MDPGPDSTSQTPPATPGDPVSPSTWQPPAPSEPVDPATVQSDYAGVLDAAIDATPADLTWSGTTVSTEVFDGLCVVKTERVGSGVLVPEVETLRDALAAAMAEHGFRDLALANDAGGALMFVAHDSSDALFEFRSKGQTTVAIRVATVAADCEN